MKSHSPSMRTLRFVACAGLFALTTVAQSRPHILHEVQYLPFTAGQGQGGSVVSIAMQGNDVISTHVHWVELPEGGERQEYFALWFERDANFRWHFRGRLATDVASSNYSGPDVAIRDGIAAVGIQPLAIFERNAAGWSRRDVTANYPDGLDIDVDAGGVLGGYGDCGWDARYFQKQGNDWVATGTITGARRLCSAQHQAEDLALSGNTALVYNRYTDERDIEEARLYRKPASGTGAWPQIATLERPAGEMPYWYGTSMDLLGGLAMITGTRPFGTHVFRDMGSGNWQPDGVMRSFLTPNRAFTRGVQLDDGLADRIALQWYDGEPTVDVFRERAGRFMYDSMLWPRAGVQPDFPIGSAAVDGFNAVVASDQGLYFFLLPETHEGFPAALQTDFDDAFTGDWMQPANHFVVTTDTRAGGRLFQQRSLAGESTAWHSLNSGDQAIEADIRPTQFQANDRWVGLMTRRTDPANYYYLTMRYPGTVQLKRMRNGHYVTLASRNFDVPVTPGRNYRVRMESIGSRHRVFVDGEQVLDIVDHLLASGSPGLITYRARADYDNVVITLRPRLESFADATIGSNAYRTNGDGWWTWDPSYGLTQSSATHIARLFVPDTVLDQGVEARVISNGFSPNSGSQWFGLMARYVDADNYYYITVRDTNELSLRKLVNGRIHVLDTASLHLSPGIPHYLRLEAVGDRIRAYANGELVVMATDSTFQGGGSGLVTYRAAATFDRVRAYQP